MLNLRKKGLQKKLLVKMLRASGKTFYNLDTNEPITVEEYVEQLLLIPVEELLAYEKEVKDATKNNQLDKEQQS